MRALYRVHLFKNKTQAMLPTPMICFDRGLFRHLAEAAINNGSKRPFTRATEESPFQNIQAALEDLGGMVVRTEGIHRSLDESFDRVASRYFQQGISRPKLNWSQALTRRKFGHYDQTRDSVMISSTLGR